LSRMRGLNWPLYTGGGVRFSPSKVYTAVCAERIEYSTVNTTSIWAFAELSNVGEALRALR